VKPKTEVKVDLIRNGEKMTLNAVIGKTKDLASVFAWDSKDATLELFRSQKNLKLPKTFALHISEKNEMDGLQVHSLTKQLGEYFGVPGGKGVMVSSVKKGSNAEQAGFKAGDVITKVNNSSVDDMSEFQEEYTEGEDEISFEVIRSGKPMNLKMKVDSDEDKDIEIEEDEDDDWSMFYRVTPPDPPNIHLTAPSRVHLHGLQEHLSNLRYELKNKMKEIKEQIRCCLKEL
jgi:C-terminal processing protease CtpA/Prc